MEEGRPECGEKSLGVETRLNKVQTEPVIDSRRWRHMPATKLIKQYKLDADIAPDTAFLVKELFFLLVSAIY